MRPAGRKRLRRRRMRYVLRADHRKWMLVVTFVCLWLGGCDRAVEKPEDFPGRYVLNRRSAQDVLTIKRDGTYVRHYTPSAGGAVIVDSGAWEIDLSSGETRIVFSDMVPRWRASTRPSYWSTYAMRSPSGVIWLNVNADRGLRYVRQPD